MAYLYKFLRNIFGQFIDFLLIFVKPEPLLNSMKNIIALLYVCVGLCCSRTIAQQTATDSLKKNLTKSMPDTARVLLLDQLSRAIMYSKPFVAMEYAEEGLRLSEKVFFDKGKARMLNRMGTIFRISGNYVKALEAHLASIKVAENNNDDDGLARTFNNIGILYSEQKDSQKAILYFNKAKTIAQKLNNQNLLRISYSNLGTDYALLKQLDSAKIYTEKGYKMAVQQKADNINVLLMDLGSIYALKGYYSQSLAYFKGSLPYSKLVEDNRTLSHTYFEMANVFNKTNVPDSAIYYAKKSLKLGVEINAPKNVLNASKLLSDLYETNDKAQAYAYFKIAITAKDSLESADKVRQFQNVGFNEQLRLEEIEQEKAEYANSVKFYAMLGAIAVFLVISLILYRNNRHKQKANVLLQNQRDEINIQSEKAEKALAKLKSTQAQLIQKEKLASLGELTAGIAHEIQNPLNFVNNFSELSVELLEELKAERQKAEGKRNVELEDEILSDLSQNQEKINFHGKRASSIVSGMLEHARASTGVKELTDINKLADEYLRLSYHGLRAKDKNGFNSDFELILDPNLPKINIIPQDIGRVILNLVNNAFYAVNVGEAASRRTVNLADVKSPKVIVKTEHTFNQLIIKVQDNGTGMSEATKAKVFQPFFTTKPTGQGTGLGLSLAYDIITKGHGGTIECESVEGVGATFIVKLPI
jgi:two-component system, NtrC family, sensor kinase